MNAVAAEIKFLNWKHSWILLAFFCALLIHIKESFYRLGTFDSFFSFTALAVLVPIIMMVSYTAFWAFRRCWVGEAPSFLAVWAVFIFFIVMSRIIITAVYVGEPLNLQVVIGIVILVYGLYLTTQNGTSLAHVATSAALVGGAWFTTNMTEIARLSAMLKLDWWMLYLFMTAVAVAALENISRRAMFERYFAFRTLAVMIPISIIIDMGTFYGYRQAVPTFMFAWAVYTMFDVALRIMNNKLLEEPFKIVHALGMLLVVSGTALSYLGGLHS